MVVKKINRQSNYEIYSQSDFLSKNKLSVGEYDLSLPKTVENGIKDFFNKNITSGCLNYPSDHSEVTDNLIQKIKSYCQIFNADVLLTAGATESLKLIFDLYLDKESRVLFPIPSYSNALNLIKNHTPFIDSPCCTNFENIKNSLEDSDYALVYICLPNNPTGYLFTEKEVHQLSDLHPETLFVIDGCYLEYEVDFQNFNLNKNNVITIRTFSKAFGLAGLRIGYLYSTQETIQSLKILRDPHLPTEISKYAGYLALQSIDEYKKVWVSMKETRLWFIKELHKLGMECDLNSRGMFILARLPNGIDNIELYQNLKENDDIIIKPLKGEVFGLCDKSYIRIGLAKRDSLNYLLECMCKYL